VDDDPPSAVSGTDDIAPWADMWRQALQAGFGTASAPSPDERPADAS